jgi:hypothetical protein
MRSFGGGAKTPPAVRTCGSIVDDVCIQLYESNQRSKYYNKIL